MKANRDEAISETLKWEGGYTNNPKDPGGPTNWGITITDAKKYWKADATAADVKAMPKSVAIDIYSRKYWKTSYYDCDTLQSGVDLAVFDFGVNSGPARAKKYLNLSVGGASKDTVTKLCDKRLAFLKGLPTWSTFGRGWSSRVAGIKAKALSLTEAKSGKAGAVITATTIGTAGTGVVVATSTNVPTHYWMYGLSGLAAVAVIVLGVLAIRSYKKFKATHV